jgi:hypothetical protein
LDHVDVVAVGADDVLSTTSKVPERDTTPAREVAGIADQSGNVAWLDISGAGGGHARRETEEELGVLALLAVLNDIDPGEVVEASLGVELALFVVVELNKEGVEFGFVDEVLEVEPSITSGTLGSSSDEKRGVELTEGLDHGNVAAVVCHSLVIVMIKAIEYQLTKFSLNIEIETIDTRVNIAASHIEGTGAFITLLVRSESLVEELGKLNTVLPASDSIVVVTVVVVTTNAEKDLYTTLLAVRNILLDGWAVAKKA